MGRVSRGKAAAASKAAPAKPTGAQQEQREELPQLSTRPQTRRRQKPPAVPILADDSDADGLLGDWGEDDWDYDPDADSSADGELADDMLAGLDDLDDSPDESEEEEEEEEEEAAARNARRKESRASARFTTDEVQQLVKKRRLAGNNNTSTQYDFLRKHLVAFCEYEMAPGVAPVRRKRPWDATLSGTDGADLAARFMAWYILDGHAGLNGKGATTWDGPSMFKKVHSMLQAVFRGRGLHMRMQGLASDYKMPKRGLLAHEVYGEVYKQCQTLFKRQAGEILPRELDPQDNTLAATYNRDQLVQMIHFQMSSPDPRDARDQSMLLAMSFTAGRGADVRERRLCELTPPLLRSCIGPARCYVIGFVQPFGKTQKGKMATKGCLRHKDPMLDVQSALGRYLVTRFTLAGEVFPDPCSRDFLTMRIWPGRGDSSRSLTYQAHRARFAKLYEAMDIKVTKVTHAPRYFSARKADEEGVPEEETARFGSWRQHSLTSVYLLTALRPGVLLVMGNWTHSMPYDQYWRPGLMVITPQPITELLLPFAAAFTARIAEADAAKKPVPVSARAMAELLPYLASVVWQDFLEIMTDRSRFAAYTMNPVFNLLLNGSQAALVRSYISKFQLAKDSRAIYVDQPVTEKQMLGMALQTVTEVKQGLLDLCERQMQQQQQLLLQASSAFPGTTSAAAAAAPAAVASAAAAAAAAGTAPPAAPGSTQGGAWLQQKQRPVTEEEEMAGILQQLKSGPDALSAAELAELQQQLEELAAAEEEGGEEQATETGALGTMQPSPTQKGPDDLEQPARVLRQPPRQQQAQQQPLPPPPSLQQQQQQQGQAQAQAQAGGAGQDEGAVLQMYEVEEPDQHHHQQMVNSPVFYSPASGFRTRSEFADRSAVSPGDHIRSWWQGGEQQQEQHIKDVCATESWRTGLMSQQPSLLPILQQQQQQQHFGQNTSGILSNTAAVAAGGWLGVSSQQPSQPQAAQQQSVLAILQQLRQHVQLEGLPLLDSLGQQVAGESTSLAATSQQQLQQQQPQHLQQQQQQLQQQQQQQLMLQAAAALQQPGLQLSGNPFGFLEPHIGSLPSTAAALGYRQDMGRSAQAMVALGDYIAARLSQQQIAGVMPGLVPADAMQAGMQRGPATAATDAAANSWGEDKVAGPVPVPLMSTFSSFSSFTSWFTAQPTGFSQSRLQLEKARDFSWRKGYDKRRWSDYRMLWSVVKGRAKQLTAAASADDVASYADAAAALDLQYNLRPSAYFTQYLKKKGSKAAVSDSNSGQAAAGRSSRKRLAQQLVEQQGEVEEVEEEVEDKEPSRQARGRGKGGKRKGAKKGRGS